VTCFVLAFAPAAAHAQKGEIDLFVAERESAKFQRFQVVESAPVDAIPHVTGAPFSADAVTEFTQILGDGNRIEQRYVSSIARDGRGRTRREEEIVLLGTLATTGPTPKLVTIVDPDSSVSYTLDQHLRVAHRSPLSVVLRIESDKVTKAQDLATSTRVTGKKLDQGDIRDVTQSLGRRSIDGVMAEGTRTTSTIPAGSIGNFQAIEIVSERWFSPELQMPVLISRNDPRTGETVYRLTNIVRAEPPADFFMVPPDYEVREGKLGVWKKLEAGKLIGVQKDALANTAKGASRNK
jgi:hypothetical protein